MSGVLWTNAFSAPEASMAARQASVSSTAVTSPLASASRASAMVSLFSCGHSTTFGTAKKPSRASGALDRIFSGMPPVGHDILAPLEAHGRDPGHRLDALDIDLVQLLHEGRGCR